MEESFSKTIISAVTILMLVSLLLPPTTAWSNGGAPDGISDSFNHHVYFYSTGDLQDDISASRAQEEYDNVLDHLTGGNKALAAKRAGIMSHYVVDLAKSLGRKA